MTVVASTAGHPDKVFGKDQPVGLPAAGAHSSAADPLSPFVEQLRATDVAALDGKQRATLADGLAHAAKRIVAEYDKLRTLGAETQKLADTLVERTREVEARERAVAAREALLGLHEPSQRRWWQFKRVPE